MKATAATVVSLFSLAFERYAKAAPALSPRQSTSIPSHSNVDVQTTLLNTTWPWREYKSSPFQPPDFTITGNGGALADGFIFLTPSGIFDKNATKQGGGFLMTDEGDLVYGVGDDGMTDLRTQTYEGNNYLTYWSGVNTQGLNIGHGYGHVNIYDEEYNLVTVISPSLNINTLNSSSNGTVDIHEHQITDAGTILLTAYNNTPADLSSILGPKNGWIVDSLVVEVDIATKEILFLWRASDHVPFTDSKPTELSPPTPGIGTEQQPYDYFHVNSIQRVGDNYLINSRHTWTTYMVAPNGTILWNIEGVDGGSFGALPSQGTFSWQHYVRANNVTETSLDLSIFDNHNNVEEPPVVPTRTLVYHLELPPSKNCTPVLSRLIQTDNDPLYAGSQGSYIPTLSNGNQFIGYGQISICREYGPGSTGSDLRWEAQFGAKNQVQNYRCQKQVWSATPAAWDPSLVVENGTAYVSWNGATNVEAWNVYTGSSSSSLSQVGIAQRAGFETVFTVPGGAPYVQVGAVQQGSEVRKSNVASAS